MPPSDPPPPDRDTLPAPPPDPDDVPTWPGHAEGRRRSSHRALRAMSTARLLELQAMGADTDDEAEAIRRLLANDDDGGASGG